MSARVEPRYLDLAALADYLSISKGSVQSLVEKGRLPQPVRFSTRLIRWDREAVDISIAKGAGVGPVLDQDKRGAHAEARQLRAMA